MKIRKIISTILALGIMASVAVMPVSADNLPEVTAEVYKYENDTENYVYISNFGEIGNEAPGYEIDPGVYDNVYIPDGMAGYLVLFSVNNIEITNPSKGSKKTLTSIKTIYSVSDSDNIEHVTPFVYADESSGQTPIIDNDFAVAPIIDLVNNGSQLKVSSTNAPSNYLPDKGKTFTEAKNVCAAFIVVKDPSKPVTFTPINVGGPGNDEYTQINLSTGDIYLKDSAMTASAFTLGEVDEFKGRVDATDAGTVYNYGFLKLVDKEFNTENYTYTVKATDAENKSNTKEWDLLKGFETDGFENGELEGLIQKDPTVLNKDKQTFYIVVRSMGHKIGNVELIEKAKEN